MSRLTCIISICLLIAGVSRAATVTWSSMGILPDSADADDEILNLGQTELAIYSPESSATTYMVNGVTFIAGTGVAEEVHATFSGWAGEYTGIGTPSNWSSNLKSIMSTGVWTNYDETGIITLEGLTVGHEYQVQFLWNALPWDQARQMSIVSGDVSTGSFNFSNKGTPDGYYTATFMADATTQTFNFIPSPSSFRAQINAVNVQLVPEPATLSLMFMSMGVLLAKRRIKTVLG